MTDQIDFACVRPEHHGSAPVEALTIHDGKWAYCPTAQADGHDWRRCAALTVHDLPGLLHTRRKGEGRIAADVA